MKTKFFPFSFLSSFNSILSPLFRYANSFKRFSKITSLNSVLEKILLDGKKVTLGTPLVNDAAVMAQVIRQTRGPKITMIYKRRRKNSRRKQGHKQDLTLLKIIDIAETGGSKLSPKKAAAKTTEKKTKVVTKPKPVSQSKVVEDKVKKAVKAKSTNSKTTESKTKSASTKPETKAKTKKTTTRK